MCIVPCWTKRISSQGRWIHLFHSFDYHASSIPIAYTSWLNIITCSNERVIAFIGPKWIRHPFQWIRVNYLIQIVCFFLIIFLQSSRLSFNFILTILEGINYVTIFQGKSSLKHSAADNRRQTNAENKTQSWDVEQHANRFPPWIALLLRVNRPFYRTWWQWRPGTKNAKPPRVVRINYSGLSKYSYLKADS